MKPNRGSTRADSGSVLIESAIALPILLLVLFGIIQYGLILSARISLHNAAALGAREAALFDRSCSQVETAVTEALSANLTVSNGNPSFTHETIVVNSEDAYRISLQYDYPVLLPYVVPGSNGSTLPITASGVMRSQQTTPLCP